MALIDTLRPYADAPQRRGRIGALFTAFAEWNDARLTRKALESLTDRELDDIGLSRADIRNLTGR